MSKLYYYARDISRLQVLLYYKYIIELISYYSKLDILVREIIQPSSIIDN